MKLDDLLESARADEPSAEQLASLENKLAGLLVPPTPGGAPAGGAAKLAIAVAGVTVVAAIAIVVVRAPSPPQHPIADAAIATDATPSDATMPPPDAAVTVTPDATPPRERAPEQSLAVEGAMLERARRALVDRDAGGALAICERHARRFPRGALREERERLAIEALVKLGRRREAVARVAAFDRAFPDSVQSERVHALLDSR